MFSIFKPINLSPKWSIWLWYRTWNRFWWFKFFSSPIKALVKFALSSIFPIHFDLIYFTSNVAFLLRYVSLIIVFLPQDLRTEQIVSNLVQWRADNTFWRRRVRCAVRKHKDSSRYSERSVKVQVLRHGCAVCASVVFLTLIFVQNKLVKFTSPFPGRRKSTQNLKITD